MKTDIFASIFSDKGMQDNGAKLGQVDIENPRIWNSEFRRN